MTGHHHKCGNKEHQTCGKGCCENEYLQLKFKDNLKTPSDEVKLSAFNFDLSFPEEEAVSINKRHKRVLAYLHYIPPLLIRDHILLDQTYLI